MLERASPLCPPLVRPPWLSYIKGGSAGLAQCLNPQSPSRKGAQTIKFRKFDTREAIASADKNTSTCGFMVLARDESHSREWSNNPNQPVIDRLTTNLRTDIATEGRRTGQQADTRTEQQTDTSGAFSLALNLALNLAPGLYP